MSNQLSAPVFASRMRTEAASGRIAAFSKRFGAPHLYLAYHAAFPLALTPDLLYRTWAYFQSDTPGKALNIPWIAVSDLLLSSLCNEVGYELYEMDASVRTLLLHDLQVNRRFGERRIELLSHFLLDYTEEQLWSLDPDERDFAQAQRWTALAYLKPQQAAHQLAEALADLYPKSTPEVVRVGAIVESLAEPLAEFVPLLTYVHGIVRFLHDERDDAINDFRTIIGPDQVIRVNDVEMPIPDEIVREVQFAGNGGTLLEHSVATAEREIMQPAVEQARAYGQRALEQVEEVINQVQRDATAAEQIITDLRNRQVGVITNEFRAARKRSEDIRDSLLQAEDIQSLLVYILQCLEEDNYKEIALHTAHDLLQQSDGASYVAVIHQLVQQMADTLIGALDTLVQRARDLGQHHDTRAQAHNLLESLVLRRYPDYSPARMLQREWEVATIDKALRDDDQDYETQLEKLNTIQKRFWSNDRMLQAQAEEMAGHIPPDTLITSSGLEQAHTSVQRLAVLSQPNDEHLLQWHTILQERAMRRWPLRLRAVLYRNQPDAVDAHLLAAQHQAVPQEVLQPLLDEREALDKINEALYHFERGEWEPSWMAARLAHAKYAHAPRINALIEHAPNAADTAFELERLFSAIEDNLFHLRNDHIGNDTLLIQVNTYLVEAARQIESYAFFGRRYGERYQRLTADYEACWRKSVERTLEGWRHSYEEASRVIAHLERMIAVAPVSSDAQLLVVQLEGRTLICQAQQAIHDARLQTTDTLLAQATKLLAVGDPSFEEVQASLINRRQFVSFLLTQAVHYRDQDELTQAFQSVSRALTADNEDADAHALQTRLREQIQAVQNQAQQAEKLEQRDLEAALVLWRAIYQQHRDGVYPAGDPSARLFLEWLQDAQRRRDEALTRIPQIRRDMQQMQALLDGVDNPNWEQFNIYRSQGLSAIELIEPGMQQAELRTIELGIRLLDRYRVAYQQLQQILDTPRGRRKPFWAGDRSKAVAALEAARTALHQFDPANVEVVQRLVDTVTVSFERIERLNRLTRA